MSRPKRDTFSEHFVFGHKAKKPLCKHKNIYTTEKEFVRYDFVKNGDEYDEIRHETADFDGAGIVEMFCVDCGEDMVDAEGIADTNLILNYASELDDQLE